MKKRKSKKRQTKPKVLKVAKHRTGTTDILRDRKRKAMKPGKRISKNGRIYYEYRRNRSDINLI